MTEREFILLVASIFIILVAIAGVHDMAIRAEQRAAAERKAKADREQAEIDKIMRRYEQQRLEKREFFAKLAEKRRLVWPVIDSGLLPLLPKEDEC